MCGSLGYATYLIQQFLEEKQIFLRLPVYKNMRILFIFWLANGAKYEKNVTLRLSTI